MQVLKKIVSLLLVAAMISSLALVAFAADETGTTTPNVVLEAFKADGSALEASESVKVGDTIKVKLKTTEALECATMNIYVTYDSEVLEADKTNSKLGDIASKFMMSSANVATSGKDDVKQGLTEGTPIVLATLANPTANVAVNANTEWAEFAFTVKSASDATKLQVVIKTASRLNGLDTEAISGLVPGNLTLSVAEAASDNISKFAIKGDSEVWIAVNKKATPTVEYTTTDGVALTADDITWRSDNETVATVTPLTVNATTAQATIKGIGEGKAHIMAKAKGHEVTFTVNVVKKTVTNIVISSPSVQDLSLALAPGRNVQLEATATPADNGGQPWKFTWSSDHPEIATVDENGLVTTVGAGTATISVKAGGIFTPKKQKIVVADLGGGEYTVSMPEDQTVLSGSTVEIPVVIGSANTAVTKYNAYDMRLSYDPAQLELVTDALVGKTTTLEKGDGTVHVIHYGDVQDVNTIAFTLRFKVLAASGTATLAMTSAQVDISANALGADAKNATLTKAATVLTVDTRYNVELPAEMAGETWAAEGKDYTFSITNPDPFYIYTVTATMNGSNVAVTTGENGTYTIANVTGDLKITLTKVGKQFNVTFDGNAKEDVVDAASTANYSKDYTFKLKKDEKFQYTFEAKIGEATYTVTGPDVEGNYKILGTAIKGDITITVTKKPLEGKIFDVSVEGSGKGDVTAPNQAIEDGDFVFTVVEEDGYIYSVAVSINGSDYTKLAEPVVSGNAKTYTIPGADVTGSIVITVTKDKAVNVTFENANPGDIRIFKENGTTRITDNKDLVKKGSDYVFIVKGIMKVYDLTVVVTENGVPKAIETKVTSNSPSRNDHTVVIKNVQGDLNIELSCAASDTMVEVLVKPYVELDGKTVYMIATRTKAGNDQGLKLDTYDGYAMYTTNLYIDQFAAPLTGKGNTFLWLTIVNEGEEFGKVQALQHLSYTNHRDSLNANKPLPKPDGVANNADVNGSKLIDVNDAQLVYDIYKGAYQSFYMTNGTNDTHVDPNYGIGASMTKFLEADVNRDMKVDLHDAAAIVNLIK